MNFIKFVRIFLLVLIVIGIGLLATQKIWVPKVVDMILKTEKSPMATYENKFFSFKFDPKVQVANIENPIKGDKAAYARVGVGQKEGSEYPVDIDYTDHVAGWADEGPGKIMNIKFEPRQTFSKNTFAVFVDTTQKRRVFQSYKNGTAISISIPDTEKTPRYIDMSSIVF